MDLRIYQKNGIGLCYRAIKQGKRRIILAAPTGAGKTVILSKITADAVSKGRSVLIVVNKNVLIEQTSKKLKAFGLRCGVIKAGYREDRSKLIQVASIDTIIRRNYPEADVIIIDEAHNSFAKKYDGIFSHYESKIILGFSATPERTKKSETLSKRYEELIQITTLQDLVEEGYLVPPVIYSIKKNTIGLDKVRTKYGEYEKGSLSLAMRHPNIIAKAVKEWKEKAENRPTIGFGVTVEHIQQLAEAFKAEGIPADYITGNTSDDDRRDLFAALRTGKIKVLFSVQVLAEGFDEPCVSCILSCRPTKSRIVYIQQIGRGLRLFDGKVDCIVLDQAENVHNLGHPLEYQPKELTEQDEYVKGAAPAKECPQCETMQPNFLTICSCCGYNFPAPDKRTDHAEMVLIEAKAKRKPRAEEVEMYTKLIILAYERKYSPDYASFKFKEHFGYYPGTAIRLHAVFADPDPGLKLDYLNYLKAVAAKKNKDEAWIKRWMSYEFGR